jgi:outer membrane protein assembly factor BamB
MHGPTANHFQRLVRLSALIYASFLLATDAPAQPFALRFGQTPQTQLTPPQVELVSGPTAARLEQARALAANKNWDEAVAIYRELAGDDSGRVVQLDGDRYVSLPTYCQMQLAALPLEGLDVYRERTDPLAEQWYRDGRANRDETKLRQVVETAFCSSRGDDALLILGELALERADFAAARRYWEQISPLLRDPAGQPMWLAVRDIDLDAQWPEIEKRWQERPQPLAWLAFPDTDLDLAAIRARLTLVSIRAGELDRAAHELDLFGRFHLTSTGRLGGQNGPYIATLEKLLASAKEWAVIANDNDWRTFAHSQSRGGIAPPLSPTLVPAWPKPVELTVSETSGAENSTLRLRNMFGARLRVEIQAADSQSSSRELSRVLNCFPVVVRSVVIFSEGEQMRAASLATGRPAVTRDGVLQRAADDAPRRAAEPDRTSGFLYNASHGIPSNTSTAVKTVVYTRVGPPATAGLDPQANSRAARIIGIDLARDGLLTFNARPEDTSWSFDGAPVGDGRHVWIALRKKDVTPHAYVACYDATSGAEVWRTSIGAADTLAVNEDEITHNLLTLVGDQIFFNTNLGLVAALDARDGKIAWLYRYDRADETTSADRLNADNSDRGPSPCLYHDGLVIVAPTDSHSVFALDALTGDRLWSTGDIGETSQLLGVVRQNLIVGGSRLRAVDVRSGEKRFLWPESEHAGIRGMGRGVIAGEDVFWPTRHDIYVVSALTGERTRSPISLSGISDGGANLAAAHGHLVVAGYDKLMALGPVSSSKPPAEAVGTDRPVQSPVTN